MHDFDGSPHGHLWLLNTVTRGERAIQKKRTQDTPFDTFSTSLYLGHISLTHMNSIQHIDELVKEYLLVKNVSSILPENINNNNKKGANLRYFSYCLSGSSRFDMELRT